MLPFMNASYFSAPSDQCKLKTLTTTFPLALWLLAGLLGCSDNDSTELDAETTQKAALLVADTDDTASDTARGPDGTTTLQKDGTYLQTVTISKKMLDNIKSVNILLGLGQSLSPLRASHDLDSNDVPIGAKAFFITQLTNFLNTFTSNRPRVTCIATHRPHTTINSNICKHLKSTNLSSTTLLNIENKMHPANVPKPPDKQHLNDDIPLNRRIVSTLMYYDSTETQSTPSLKHRIFVGSPKTHHNLLITARANNNPKWLSLTFQNTGSSGDHYDPNGAAAEWFIKNYGSLNHFQLFHLNGRYNHNADYNVYEGRPLLEPTKFSGRYFDRVIRNYYAHHDTADKVARYQSDLRRTFLTMIASIVDHVYLQVTAEHFIDEIISITLPDKNIVIPTTHYKKGSGSNMKLLYPLESGEKVEIVYRGTPASS